MDIDVVLFENLGKNGDLESLEINYCIGKREATLYLDKDEVDGLYRLQQCDKIDELEDVQVKDTIYEEVLHYVENMKG
ncbi:MAG: hypothetical protein WC444_04615 [Candidatus Paceibacterota bacterium]